MTNPEGEEKLAAFTGHGGRIGAARARYPHAVAPWIDLSTGIAPWGYSIPKLSVECWTRLPEPDALEGLVAAARQYYRVPDGMKVAPVTGSDMAIGLIPRLVTRRVKTAIVSPTYGSHAQAWRAAGHEVIEVDGLDGISGCDIGVVVNPNNPDGRVWPPGELRDVAARLARRGGFLVIDEAFGDVNPEQSVLGGEAVPGAVVLRSFGKFFGLAGVRLGFVISDTWIAGMTEQVCGAWPVSGAAVEIATRAYGDREWAAAQRRRLNEAGGRLREMLAAAELNPNGNAPLFQLAEHPAGARLFDHLASAGILVRPFADGTKLRFGLPGDEAAWQRLDAALTGWKPEGGGT